MSWIMIAGPYGAGGADAALRSKRLDRLNQTALAVFDKGHIPVIGVNMALPMIEAAGDDRYDEIMMPVSLALAERCDAILRVGGPSQGADRELALIRDVGKPVYFSVDEVPEPPR